MVTKRDRFCEQSGVRVVPPLNGVVMVLVYHYPYTTPPTHPHPTPHTYPHTIPHTISHTPTTLIFGAKKFIPVMAPALFSARASLAIAVATARHKVSLNVAACPIGMGKDVGQPEEFSPPLRQPERMPWHASEN